MAGTTRITATTIWVTILLPVWALGVQVAFPERTAEPGQTVVVPVVVGRAAGLAGFQMTVRFDPGLAKSVRVEKGVLAAGWTVAANTTRAGEVKIIAVDPTLKGVTGDGGVLANLTFDLAGTAVPSGDLVLSECKLRDPQAEVIPAEPMSGKIVFPAAAQESAAQAQVNSGVFSGLCPGLGVFLVAGVFLAVSRLRLAGFIAAVAGPAASAGAVTIAIPNISTVPGAGIDVPITIDNASGVAGFQFKVIYDNTTLKATAVTSGSLLAGWMVTPNISISGEVRVVGVGSLDGLPAGGGNLLILKFTVLGTVGQGSDLSFSVCKLRDGSEAAAEIPSTTTPGHVSIDDYGTVQVGIAPVEAASAGAKWRVAGGDWKAANETVNLLPGQYTLEFMDVSGWTTPGTQTVTVAVGQTALDAGTYVQQTGFVKVTLMPAGAVAAGALWRVNGGTWQASDQSCEVPVGSQTVEFGDVAGWIKPDNLTLTVTANQTTSQTAKYIEKGDIDSSDSVDVTDVILCMRMSVSLSVLVGGQTCADPYPAWLTARADRNSTGDVDISDVVLILRRSVEN